MSLQLLSALMVWVLTSVGSATAPVGAEMSAGATWDPYNEVDTWRTARRLSAEERKLVVGRANQMFDAFKAAPSFNTPHDCATMLTSTARMETASLLTRAWPGPRHGHGPQHRHRTHSL